MALTCDWDAGSFRATAIYTGENRLIRVQASGTCPRGGYEVRLEPDNPGIHPEPSELVLRIVEDAPEIGTDVLTPINLDDYTEASQEVNTVVIRELDLRLPVTEPA